MVGDPTSGLCGDGLVVIVEIDATVEQEDNQQNACDFLVTLIKRIGNRLHLFLGDRRLQHRCHGNDEECHSANPDDRRHHMKPMNEDRDQRIRIGNETVKRVRVYHS